MTWWNVLESSMLCKSAWLSSLEISRSLHLQQLLITQSRPELISKKFRDSVLTEWAEFPASLTSIFGARWNSTDASPSTGLLSFRAHTDYYQLRRLPRTVQANTLYRCTVLKSYVSITLAPLSCYSCSWFLAVRCKITNLFLPIMCLSFRFEVKSLHNFFLFSKLIWV